MSQTGSVAAGQFPLIVWRDGEKRLWNPIHRRALKNRPEERVRLRVIEYLIHGGWSRHRISTEETIRSAHQDEGKRTDIICYTQEFDPCLLIECKAESVLLSDETALQVAGYNRRVDAPFLLLTNGQTDYWYSLDNDSSMRPLSNIPEPLPDRANANTADKNYDYWRDRGFAGSEASPALRSWLKQTLGNNLIENNSGPLQYLSFNQQLTDLDLSHYYQIQKLGNCRVALGFTSTEYGDSRLVAILGVDGENAAVMEINLDLLADERAPNASVYWAGGPKNCDIRAFTNQLLNDGFNSLQLAKDVSSKLMETIN